MTHPHLEGLISAVLSLQPRKHANDATRLWQLFESAEAAENEVRQALAALPGGGVDDNVANLVSCSAAILHLLDGGITPYAVKEDLRAALVPFLPTPTPHEADRNG